MRRKEDVGRFDHLYGEGIPSFLRDEDDDFDASRRRRRRTTDEWVIERKNMSPPGWLFSRLDFGTATASDKDARRRGRRCRRRREEGSVLIYRKSTCARCRRDEPDIFPDLKEIKQPMPNPLPGDPEMPDEEEEEKERKENPGEPGEDEEEDENGEKISKKEEDERRRKRTRSKTKDRRSPTRCNSILSVCCNEIRAYFNNVLRRVILFSRRCTRYPHTLPAFLAPFSS